MSIYSCRAAHQGRVENLFRVRKFVCQLKAPEQRAALEVRLTELEAIAAYLEQATKMKTWRLTAGLDLERQLEDVRAP